MSFNNVKVKRDGNGFIEKAKVEKIENGKKIANLNVTIGSEFVVANKRLKHYGRKVKVHSFKVENERNKQYGLRVNVTFLDNGRRGIIDITDLDSIPS